MDENNSAKLSINEVKINLYNSENFGNNFELNNNNNNIGTEANLQLNNTALAKVISEPSTSQQLVCTRNKNPIKKQKKGKVKIISIVHIPKSIDDRIINQKRNRYIPIILKKSFKSKLKVQNSKAISSLAASIFENNFEDMNFGEREAANMAEPLTNLGGGEIQETANSNALLIRKELVIQLPNLGQVQGANLNMSRQVEQYFSSKMYTDSHSRNVYEEQYLCCSLAANNIFGDVRIPGPPVEILPSGNGSHQMDIPDVSMHDANSNGTNVVSILECNQLNVQGDQFDSSNGIEAETESEIESEASSVSGSSESGVSVLSESLSSEKSATSYESGKSTVAGNAEDAVADESDSFGENSETETASSGASSETEKASSGASSETEVENEKETSLSVASVESEVEGETEKEKASPEMKTTLFENEMQVASVEANESEMEMVVSESAEAEAANKEEESGMMKSSSSSSSRAANTSEFVTVASDDIPYNAEVEIGNNNGEEEKKMRTGDGLDLDFDEMKKRERSLFLELEDAEFCRAAQRRSRSIRRFGRRGFRATGNFNDILKQIPGESPATVHALLVACDADVPAALGHLRYIRETRQHLQHHNTNAPSSSTGIIQDTNRQTDTDTDTEAEAEAQAKIKAENSTPNTRKKKISYNIDLSDNYPDDSDEDYFPGKDITLRKKKRSKRRSKTCATSQPVYKVTNKENVNGKEKSILTMLSNKQQDDGKELINDEKKRDPRKHKELVVDLLKRNETVYKAEAVHQEVLELVNFKKKRSPNLHVVPPIQKFMYAHEGDENSRYMTLSKQ